MLRGEVSLFEKLSTFLVTAERWVTETFTSDAVLTTNMAPYIDCLNPVEMHNAQGRIMRYMDGKQEDMIFVKTRNTDDTDDVKQDAQTTIDFRDEDDDDDDDG